MDEPIIRKRNGNSQRQTKPKVGFVQGFKLWLNQWKPSSIKATYNKEYARVRMGTQYRLDKIQGKL